MEVIRNIRGGAQKLSRQEQTRPRTAAPDQHQDEKRTAERKPQFMAVTSLHVERYSISLHSVSDVQRVQMRTLITVPARKCRRPRLFLGAGTVLVTLSLAWAHADQPPAVTAVLTSAPARAAYLARATIWRDPGPLTPEAIVAGPPGIFPYTVAAATSDAGIGCLFTKPGKELGGASVKFLCTTSDKQELRVEVLGSGAGGGQPRSLRECRGVTVDVGAGFRNAARAAAEPAL